MKKLILSTLVFLVIGLSQVSAKIYWFEHGVLVDTFEDNCCVPTFIFDNGTPYTPPEYLGVCCTCC